MAYHAFTFEDGSKGGSFEVFYVSTRWRCESQDSVELLDLGPGWYWWPCFPGCLPEDNPSGPFETADAAIEDANS